LVHPRQLLHRDAQRHVVPALPVVLARDRQPEQSHPPHLRDDLHRQAALGVVVVAGGGDDLVGELAHLRGEALVLLAQQICAGRGRGGGGHGGLLLSGGAHAWWAGAGWTASARVGWAASARAAWSRACRRIGASTIRPSCSNTPVPCRSAA